MIRDGAEILCWLFGGLLVAVSGMGLFGLFEWPELAPSVYTLAGLLLITIYLRGKL